MNRLVRPAILDQPPPRITNAAEGLPRRAFTFAEAERMTEIGILHEDDHVELIGGEFVVMPPKGNHHEVMKAALNLHWAARLAGDLTFITETTFRLSDDTYLEPDFVFYPKSVGWKGLAASTARLVVEIADSSFRYDTRTKAGLYAGFGIVEFWVIHAVKREARIHRDPSPEGYRTVLDIGPDQPLVPMVEAALAVTLTKLELF